MKIIKRMIYEPREAVYEDIKVFDDLYDYTAYFRSKINDGRDFTRIGFGNWERIQIEGDNYYHHEYEDNYLTEEAYKELLSECEKTYLIHESKLLRTQRHSNARFTGKQPSVEAVLDYMKGEKSWLHQVNKEIDEEIADLQKKIDKLKKDKETINDEEYLKSKIETEYTFDSKKYFESKGVK